MHDVRSESDRFGKGVLEVYFDAPQIASRCSSASRRTKTMSNRVVSCLLPEKLIGAIDKRAAKTLDNRASWMREAIFEKAARDGLLRREANPADALEIEQILG